MEFTFVGTDPRYLYLKRRLEADGHVLTTDSPLVIAPPAQRRGVPYWSDPIFALENAALTAEGAAELIMRRTDRALPGLQVLVVGFGRIGSMLADKLAALGASVTAAARSPAGFRGGGVVRSSVQSRFRFFSRLWDVSLFCVPAPPRVSARGLAASLLSGPFVCG